MNLNTSKFEVNDSLEYFHMTVIGKKEVLLASNSQQKTEVFHKIASCASHAFVFL